MAVTATAGSDLVRLQVLWGVHSNQLRLFCGGRSGVRRTEPAGCRETTVLQLLGLIGSAEPDPRMSRDFIKKVEPAREISHLPSNGNIRCFAIVERTLTALQQYICEIQHEGIGGGTRSVQTASRRPGHVQ